MLIKFAYILHSSKINVIVYIPRGMYTSIYAYHFQVIHLLITYSVFEYHLRDYGWNHVNFTRMLQNILGPIT